MIVAKGMTGESKSLEDTGTVHVHLSWDEALPVQVRALFTTPSDQVVWVFSTELLREGLLTITPNMAGADHGDIKIGCTWNTVNLSLRSPDGTAVVELPWEPVASFAAEVANALVLVDSDTAMLAQVDAFLNTLNIESF